jgi:predicted dehydrogenase
MNQATTTLTRSDFGAVARGEVAPLVSARDGLKNLRITEAIVTAATQGTIVELSRD